MLGGNDHPYYGGDEIEVQRLLEEFYWESPETWICDRAFTWCIEFRRNSNACSFARSPYTLVAGRLKQRLRP